MARPFRLTQEEKQQISDLYSQGKSMKQVAQSVGRSRDSVDKVIRKTGIFQESAVQQHEIDFMIDHYQRGDLSKRKIAYVLGRDVKTVDKHLKKAGIETIKPKGILYSDGYVLVLLYKDSQYREMGMNVTPYTQYVREHRLVMAKQLGRPLLPEEEVHHKNGVRDDNRIENLELWTGSHPKGQRVEDLLSWADELIEQYR